MEDQLLCPICHRDYELPRRYAVRLDDVHYQTVPRLLSCLHTCCQSCLEDIFEKNDARGVTCPQCGHFELLQGVRYLPIDGSAISQLIPLDGASLSYCSRCRDEVPSYSWCEICCSTLCEFHHQDHKLSASTATHKILTFKMITNQRIAIEPRMPPVCCPENIDQDATLYCHDCNLLVSPQVMFTKHASHRCSESNVLAEWARDLITYSVSSSLQRQDSLIKAIKSLRSTIRELDQNRENAEENIRSIFQDLRTLLDSREREMLNRLDEIASRKQDVINSQLEDLSTALEKCRHSIFVGESLLSRTEKVKGGDQYLVSAASTISRRGEEIDEDIIRISFEPQTDPFLRGYFIEQEVKALKTIIRSFGGIITQDNIPVGQGLEDRKIHSVVKDIFSSNHQVTFTVQTRSPPKLSNDKKQTISKEAVIVEARLKLITTPESECKVSESVGMMHSRSHICTPNSLELLHRLNDEPLLSKSVSDNSLDRMLGDVVGQVVFLTEVDSLISSKHPIKSTYESFLAEDSLLPTLRVTREIL